MSDIPAAVFAGAEPLVLGDGQVQLWCGDCVEIMPRIGNVDAVVTDPPFGIGADKGRATTKGSGFYSINLRNQYVGNWDHKRPNKDVFDKLIEMSAEQIIWGGNYFTDFLRMSPKWLCWDKCQTMPTYSDCELAWTNLNGVSVKKFVYSNNGLLAREKNRVHPTQKPIAVMEWCLGFLPMAETVFDPFMGSGTTGVACVRLGRRFIGIEIDRGYFEIAVRRITEELAAPRLALDTPLKAEQTTLDLGGAA